MNFFIGVLVLGTLCQNTLARGLDNPVLDDFERRLVRLEARQFSERENLEHRMLKLETHLGIQNGEETLERSPLERNLYTISHEKKPAEGINFIERLEKLEKSWEKKLEEHLKKLSSKHEDLSKKFSVIKRQLEERQRKALSKNVNTFVEKAKKKSEDLEQQEFLLVKKPINKKFSETGSGFGESEPEFGSGFGESDLEIEQSRKKMFQRIGQKYYFIEKDEEKKKSWGAALSYCKQLNAHLASLENIVEWFALRNNLELGQGYWIDITDQLTEGTLLSALAAPVLNWGYKEPSSSPLDKDCVELDNRIHPKMNDTNCMDEVLYVCELN